MKNKMTTKAVAPVAKRKISLATVRRYARPIKTKANTTAKRSRKFSKLLKQLPKNGDAVRQGQKAEEIRGGLGTYWRNHQALGSKFVATSKYGTFINDEVLDVLNESVAKSEGKKPVQLTIYRCPPGTKVKGDKIICPNGQSPKLAGLTSTASAFTSNKGSYNNNEENQNMKTKNNKTKNSNKTNSKKTNSRKSFQLFGYPVSSVVRRLGRLGWEAGAAIKAIHAKLPAVAIATIRTKLHDGRAKLDFPMADLTKAQIAELKRLSA